MLDWVTTALLSAAIMGVASILDSHLLSRRMPSLRAFLLPASPVLLAAGLIVWYFVPFPEGMAVPVVLLALSIGLIRGVAVCIMLYQLKQQEVSRVIPIIYSYPVLVAIMAVPLLGEALSYLEWLAIAVVVIGAIMVSAEKSPDGSKSWLRRTTFYLVFAGACFAGADIATKYILGYLPFLNAYSLTAIGISSSFFIFSIRPQTIRELRDLKQKKSTLSILLFNEIMAPMAIMLSYWAMQRGPVSLVATVVGSRPVFVVIYTLILSRILPGFLLKIPSMKVFMLRLAAIFMIFGGISIIYLT